MRLTEIIFLGIGLAMDAFAVSVCKGLSMKKIKWKSTFIIAIYFGIFQALMPGIGYFLGSTFSSFVQKADHWIAFKLLSIIGGNMIKESRDDEIEKRNDRVDFKTKSIIRSFLKSFKRYHLNISFTRRKRINVKFDIFCIFHQNFTFLIRLVPMSPPRHQWVQNFFTINSHLNTDLFCKFRII